MARLSLNYSVLNLTIDFIVICKLSYGINFMILPEYQKSKLLW